MTGVGGAVMTVAGWLGAAVGGAAVSSLDWASATDAPKLKQRNTAAAQEEIRRELMRYTPYLKVSSGSLVMYS
jgi:hypothetical protein